MSARPIVRRHVVVQVTGIRRQDLLGFAGPGLDVMALGALERVQLKAGALGFDPEQPRPCSALGAGGSGDRIGVRGGWLIGGHRPLCAFALPIDT